MSSPEFSLIEDFFNIKSPLGFLPEVGIGDDCAVLNVPNGKQLAVSTDTLVEGVHFLPNSSPELLGHKVLAVNLSDLAAMGAAPAWVSLAITLPAVDKVWLAAFSKGFFSLAEQFNLQLIGGDTTRGPLAITITIMGLLPTGKRLMRSGARVGDSVYVSGHIGSAGLGLKKAKENAAGECDALTAYLSPTPRVDLGKALLGIASSCIDVSDGLSADLNHLLRSSGVGATIQHDSLPVSDQVRHHIDELSDPFWPYSTGDDYELCFTVSDNSHGRLLESLSGHKVTKIGVIDEALGLRIQTNDGNSMALDKGYDHFSIN